MIPRKAEPLYVFDLEPDPEGLDTIDEELDEDVFTGPEAAFLQGYYGNFSD